MTRRCAKCGAENRVPFEKLDKRARCGRCKEPLSDAEPIALADEAGFTELIGRSPLPVIVDFWAPWCGPCRMVAPEIEKLARAKAGRYIVAKLNTDEVPTIASKYQIQSIPTVMLFRNGQVDKRVAGAMPMSAMANALGV